MRTSFLSFVGLLACGAVETPVEQQALPITLSATVFVPGQPASLIVEGAAPFERVHFIRGIDNAAGPCIQSAGNLCLDIADITYMGNRFADGTGRASFDVVVPTSLPPGTEGWFQSVIIRGPASVKTGAVYVQIAGDDRDGDGHPEATDCDDDDARVYPGATEVCDGVDNDCDASTTEDGLILVDGNAITAPYAIEQALTQVNYGGTIELCAGTWPIRSELYLDQPVTIRGQGAGVTILEGQGTVTPLLRIEGVGVYVEEVSITGMTNQNVGSAVNVQCLGGGCNVGGATFRGVEFYGNTGRDGSAIRVYESGITLEDSLIRDNTAGTAAVYLHGSVAQIHRTTFRDNYAFVDESALFIGYGTEVNATEVVFHRNDAASRPAIHLTAQAATRADQSFVCTDCDFGVGLDDNPRGDLAHGSYTATQRFDWFGVQSIDCNGWTCATL